MARILLADDDKGAQDLVRRALEMDGHAVVTAGDGADALKELTGGAFDVMVADVQMPGVDGVELARKAHAIAGAMRIIMISASQESLDQARGLGIPGVRLLTKPFGIDRIRAEVRSLLGGGR